MTEETTNSKMKTGLILWANKHQVTPTMFAERTGWVYAYAWSVLRGKADFTPSSLGVFALAYGSEAVAELLKLSNLPDGIDSVDLLPGQGDVTDGVDKDASPVLVVTKKPTTIKRVKTVALNIFDEDPEGDEVAGEKAIITAAGNRVKSKSSRTNRKSHSRPRPAAQA